MSKAREVWQSQARRGDCLCGDWEQLRFPGSGLPALVLGLSATPLAPRTPSARPGAEGGPPPCAEGQAVPGSRVRRPGGAGQGWPVGSGRRWALPSWGTGAPLRSAELGSASRPWDPRIWWCERGIRRGVKANGLAPPSCGYQRVQIVPTGSRGCVRWRHGGRQLRKELVP